MQRSDGIAIAAVLISIGSLVISFCGYKSQEQAAELSILPAVSIWERYEMSIRDSDSDDKITTFQWMIENTGLGPAFTHSAFIVIDGSKRYIMDSQEGWESIKEKLNQVLGMEEIFAFETDPISCPDAVKAGSEWPLFSISYSGDLGKKVMKNTGIDLVICYCSSHGECFYEGTGDGLISCPTEEIEPEQLLSGKGCGNQQSG